MTQNKNSLALIGLLSAFSLLTFDLYQPALSPITNYFETTPNLGQLTLSIYLLSFGISQLIWGPLIDHFGRRLLLPSSLVLAAISSLLCALAPTITLLIVGRALQGVAICCAHLVAFSSSRDYEDPLERAKILSYISMIVSVSPIFAPVVGSVIFTYFGWQANFIVMAGIAVTLLIQSNKGLIESPFWTKPTTAFSLSEVVQSYQEIIGSPILRYGSLIMMFSFAAVMFSVINSAYLIMDVLGYSPFGFGIIFIFNGLNIIVGNYLGIWLRRYFSMGITIYLGNALIMLGGIGMMLITTRYEFNLLALSFALVSNLGISVSAPPTMSLTLTEFKEHTSSALAFINTIRMLGSSLLSMLVGYYLMYNLNALAIGLISAGGAALYCGWQFNRLTEEEVTPELDTAAT
jgi:DHA1 family bicyclomycin/chloramphenicol resistance-like MFS transporter